MPRRNRRRERQPPFILLDHNVPASVAVELAQLGRFRQVGEREREERFASDASDLAIFRGPRRFLFVTQDRDFLVPSRLPNQHGGVLVFTCPPARVADALRRLLLWWGPDRHLLRNRVFRLSLSSGVEVLRDGTTRPIRHHRALRTPRYGP